MSCACRCWWLPAACTSLVFAAAFAVGHRQGAAAATAALRSDAVRAGVGNYVTDAAGAVTWQWAAPTFVGEDAGE